MDGYLPGVFQGSCYFQEKAYTLSLLDHHPAEQKELYGVFSTYCCVRSHCDHLLTPQVPKGPALKRLLSFDCLFKPGPKAPKIFPRTNKIQQPLTYAASWVPTVLDGSRPGPGVQGTGAQWAIFSGYQLHREPHMLSRQASLGCISNSRQPRDLHLSRLPGPPAAPCSSQDGSNDNSITWPAGMPESRLHLACHCLGYSEPGYWHSMATQEQRAGERDLNVLQKWLEKSAAQASVFTIKVVRALLLAYCVSLLRLLFANKNNKVLLFELRFCFCFARHHDVVIVGIPPKIQHAGLPPTASPQDWFSSTIYLSRHHTLCTPSPPPHNLSTALTVLRIGDNPLMTPRPARPAGSVLPSRIPSQDCPGHFGLAVHSSPLQFSGWGPSRARSPSPSSLYCSRACGAHQSLAPRTAVSNPSPVRYRGPSCGYPRCWAVTFAFRN